MNLLNIVLICFGVGFGVLLIILLIKAYFPIIIKVVGILILIALMAVGGYYLSTITIPI